MATPLQIRQARRRVRTFVAVWTFITFVMGAATFLAIAFTYRPNIDNDDDLNVALAANNGVGEAVVIPSQTPQPVTPTSTPTQELVATQAVVVAQALPSETPTETSLPPTPTNTATPRPSEVKAFEAGIQVQFSLDFNPRNQDGLYNSVANDLGLGWVKHQVRWEYLEPEKGQYDWSTLDFVMPSAEKFGLKMLLSIVTAPNWSREQGVNLEQHGPPANYQDYVNFVTEILKRYPHQVHAVEVWNEMNLDREWTSLRGLSAADYTEMLRQTYAAIKAIDPGIIVISGALSPTGFDDGKAAVDDFKYTDQMIQAGALNYMDCFGAHANGVNIPPTVRWNDPYVDDNAKFRGFWDNPHPSWSFRSTLEGYATRIRAAGKTTPLCVTEFGWAVNEDLDGVREGFEFASDNTLEEQGRWIPEAFTFMEQSGFVRLAIVWNFNYGPQAGYDIRNDNVAYSLIRPGYTFSPAYDGIRAWQQDYKARMGQN
jgi:hypothetical protein